MLLKAQTREVVGKQVKTIRTQKMVPASVYGPGTPTINIVVADKDFRQLYKEAGYSKLFDLEVEGQKPMKALLKEVQVNKLKGALLHVSIYAVDMKKAITTSIPIRFDGVSMAVKNNLGLVVTSLTHINVTCLPDLLPNEVVVDIGKMDNVGDSVFIKDLNLPEGVNVVGQSKEAVIATIASPQKAIEDETPAAATAEGEAAAAAPEAEEKAE